MKMPAPLASLLMTAMTAAFVAAPVLSASAADLDKGKASYEGVCIACHGAVGNSPLADNPSLAHQHPAYLVKQLKEFKEGVRVDPVMQGMSAMLSDEDMDNVAAWLAQQSPELAPAEGEVDPAALALGERIYRGGVPDRKIAACAGCHSPNGAGLPVNYPRLSGQHAKYTHKQLTEFRSGVRHNAEMNDVAAKLNDKEINALSSYIAGLQ